MKTVFRLIITLWIPASLAACGINPGAPRTTGTIIALPLSTQITATRVSLPTSHSLRTSTSDLFTETPSPIPPIPVSTSTPTLSPDLFATRLLFQKEGKLWIWDTHGSRAITDVDDQTHIAKLSEDGTLIVFDRGGDLLSIQSDGARERILIKGEDFKPLQHVPAGVSLFDVEWVPGTHHVLFNTGVITEFGYFLVEDLYFVDVDTFIWNRLLRPRGGGEFHVSSNGDHVIIVGDRLIMIMDLVSHHYRVVLKYLPVSIYGEGKYYPQIIWSPDGQSVWTAIPDHDPMSNPNEVDIATVWKIDVASGDASKIGEFGLFPYSREIVISPNGTRLLYVNGYYAEYHLSSLDGLDDRALLVPPDFNTWYDGEFIKWSPDENHFTLWSKKFGYILGNTEGNYTFLDNRPRWPYDFYWIDEENFIYLDTNSQDVSKLILGNVHGSNWTLLEGLPQDFKILDYKN